VDEDEAVLKSMPTGQSNHKAAIMADIKIRTSGSWTAQPDTMAMANGCCIAERSPIANARGSRGRAAFKTLDRNDLRRRSL
jgi:hypothetical protein